MTTLLENTFSNICARLLEAKKQRPKPWIAAFDADGTLWDTDLGEALFDYQIRNHLVPLPNDPWDYYLTTKKVDTPRAYLWLAQICKGQHINQVREWAESAVKDYEHFPILKFQKKLIEFLLKEEFEIYIITASIKWAVEPGALRLGLRHDNVLGVTTKIISDIITDIQEGPITWRKGKAEALLEKTKGVRPILASGNTPGDLHLLELATDVVTAVLSQKPNEHNYSTELELQAEAKKRGWITIDLSADEASRSTNL